MKRLNKKTMDAIEHVMQHDDGDLTFAEFTTRCGAMDRSEAIEIVRAEVPDWPTEWIEWNLLWEDLADMPNGWLCRGVASRISTGSVGEYSKFILMNARQDVLCPTHDEDEYPTAWTFLQSLAMRDQMAVDRLVKESTYPLKPKGPFCHFYNALHAAIRDDFAGLTEPIARATKIKQPQWLKGLMQCLAAIDSGSPDEFRDGLDLHLKHFSKSFHPEPLETVISFAALGMYRLAELKSPDLCKAIDTTRDLPWDSLLFEWQSASDATLDQSDFPNCPPSVVNAFITLERPEWICLP